MKVKQTVTTKFSTVFCSWCSLDFTDENGDEVQIRMTDDDYLEVYRSLKTKADRIRKERAEAAKLAEENADE